MNLLGLNQNLANAPQVGTSSTSGDNSQLSNQSSDKFQNTLDRFSKNPEGQKNHSSQNSADQKMTQGQTQSGDLKANRFQKDHQPYRKPVNTVPKSVPQQGPQDKNTLADEQIQAKIEGGPQVAVATPKNATVDSLTRRAAIQSFMQKMESKLGVDPNEIVEAFQKLSLQELAAPPEQNVEKIIAFLNLDPQQQQTAKTFFDEMLAQSSAQSIAEYLKATDRELSLSVMSQNQIRQEKLQQGLANMNQQFFTQPQVSQQPQTMHGQQQNSSVAPEFWALGAGTAGLAGYASGEATQGAGAGQAGATGLGQMMQPLQTPANGATTQNMMNSQSQMAQSQTGMELGQEWTPVSDGASMEVADIEKMVSATKNTLGKSAYGMNPQAASPQSVMSKGMDSFSMTDAGMGSAESGMDWQMSGAAASGQQSSAGDEGQNMNGSNPSLQEMVDAGELADAEGMEFQVKAESGAAAANSGNSTTAAKAPSFLLTNQPTDAEQAQNVKEVVTQANLLVKKGGGEMKVALNPEGMGQVNLKVAVNDGQVSVEMVTESNEVKKLLEKGLGDLKANLASHKLNVDNVKVDFSGEIAKQFDHAHDEAQRQSAQNFMEQFRNQNQSWRQNFFDVPGAKSGRHPNEAGPQDELTQVQSGKKKTSSRRLDLVA